MQSYHYHHGDKPEHEMMAKPEPESIPEINYKPKYKPHQEIFEHESNETPEHQIQMSDEQKVKYKIIKSFDKIDNQDDQEINHNQNQNQNNNNKLLHQDYQEQDSKQIIKIKKLDQKINDNYIKDQLESNGNTINSS